MIILTLTIQLMKKINIINLKTKIYKIQLIKVIFIFI